RAPHKAMIDIGKIDVKPGDGRAWGGVDADGKCTLARVDTGVGRIKLSESAIRVPHKSTIVFGKADDIYKKASDSPTRVIDGEGGGAAARTRDGIRLIQGGDGTVRRPHEAMMGAGRIYEIPSDYPTGVDAQSLRVRRPRGVKADDGAIRSPHKTMSGV